MCRPRDRGPLPRRQILSLECRADVTATVPKPIRPSISIQNRRFFERVERTAAHQNGACT